MGGYIAKRVGLRRGLCKRCGASLNIGFENGADAHADGKGWTRGVSAQKQMSTQKPVLKYRISKWDIIASNNLLSKKE